MRSGLTFYGLGLLFFLTVKGLLVILPSFSFGMPRLGDDALVYLWTARMNELRGQDLPALSSLRSLAALNDSPGEQLSARRKRALMRGHSTRFGAYYALGAMLLKSGLSLKAAFACLEATTALILALGIGSFLRALFGSGASAWGLIFLGAALLPNQGLHYLIPSVMNLGLGLMLWAAVLEKKITPATVMILGVLLATNHEIGAIYLLAALVLLGAKGSWGIRGALFFCLALSWVMSPPSSSPSASLQEMSWTANGGAAFSYLKTIAVTQGFILVLALSAVLLYPRQIFSQKFKLVSGLTVVLLALSLLHNLKGYPAELFTRILVLPIILAAGAAGVFCERFWPSAGVFKRAVLTAWLIGLFSGQGQALWTGINQNLNSRAEIIQEKSLKAGLARLPEQTDLFYLDTDIALMAALLEGAGRRPAWPIPLIKEPDQLRALLKSGRQNILVALPPTELNTLAWLGWPLFPARRHGVALQAFQRLSIKPEKSWREIYVYAENSGSAIGVPVENGAPALFQIPARHRGWLKLPGKAADLTLILPKSNAWILGVNSRPDSGVRWPWGSETRLTAQPRNTPRQKLELSFSWDLLMERAGVSWALPLLPRPWEALSDDSGLIFIRLPSGILEKFSYDHRKIVL